MPVDRSAGAIGGIYQFFSSPTSQRRDAIVAAIADLYSSSSSPEHLYQNVFPYIHDHVEFNDPGLNVQGIKDYQAQFLSLRPLFAPCHMNIANVSHSQDTIIIEATTNWTILTVLRIKIPQITILRLIDTGFGLQVRSHRDIWDTWAIIENIPFVGPLYKNTRSLIGIGTSAILRMLYNIR